MDQPGYQLDNNIKIPDEIMVQLQSISKFDLTINTLMKKIENFHDKKESNAINIDFFDKISQGIEYLTIKISDISKNEQLYKFDKENMLSKPMNLEFDKLKLEIENLTTKMNDINSVVSKIITSKNFQSINEAIEVLDQDSHN